MTLLYSSRLSAYESGSVGTGVVFGHFTGLIRWNIQSKGSGTRTNVCEKALDWLRRDRWVDRISMGHRIWDGGQGVWRGCLSGVGPAHDEQTAVQGGTNLE
jgi:hypothetical protein